MIKIRWLAFSLLLICLFIYVFYRTENTVINEIIIALFSKEIYLNYKSLVTHTIQIPELFIHSLAEGLYVLVITLLSKGFYFPLFKFKFKMVFLPLILAVLLEFCQLFQLTKGTFDVMDLLFSFILWLVGYLLIKSASVSKNILSPIQSSNLICVGAYALVFLAHVSTP